MTIDEEIKNVFSLYKRGHPEKAIHLLDKPESSYIFRAVLELRDYLRQQQNGTSLAYDPSTGFYLEDTGTRQKFRFGYLMGSRILVADACVDYIIENGKLEYHITMWKYIIEDSREYGDNDEPHPQANGRPFATLEEFKVGLMDLSKLVYNI